MTATASPPRDAAKIPEKGLPEVAFPGACAPEFRVHFDEAVHDQVVKHAAETLEVELCGILVGQMRRDRHGPYLAITGAIRGEHAENDGAQVKLTHATWDHVHKVKDEKFPKEQIVGWYHTHPGFGIFLSQMDLFIHDFFFNAPSQVAHVIDPRTRDEGVFLWSEGKVARAPRFWVGGAEKKTAAAAQPALAVGSRPASTPSGAAARAESAAKEDEIDLAGASARFLRDFLPVLLGALIGFLGARVFALPVDLELARQDALRSEVRALVGTAASSWTHAVELREIERRIDAELAAVAPGGATPTAALAPEKTAGLARDMADLRAHTEGLARSADERESEIGRVIAQRTMSGVALEDELRQVARDGADTRRLALGGFLAGFRSQLDIIRLSGHALAPAERDAYARTLEAALASEPSEERRAAYRAQFPDLAPPAAPAPAPQAQAKPPEKR